MSNQKTLFIFNHPHFRSQSVISTYRYLRDNPTNKMRTYVFADYPMIPADLKSTYDEMSVPLAMKLAGLKEPPDAVLGGARQMGAIVNSRDYIKEHDIKSIYTIQDTEYQFGTVRPENELSALNNTQVDWTALLVQNPKECTPFTERILWATEDMPMLKNKPLEYIPFGVDTDRFCPPTPWTDKNIDVMAVYTMSDSNVFQVPRKFIAQKVAELSVDQYLHPQTGKKMSGVMVLNKVQPEKSMFKQGEKYYDFRVGVLPLPDKYADLMNHTWISFADTSSRDYTTAKYYELGASGAMIIGEKPVGSDYLFEDGKTFIELDMDNLERDAETKIMEWVRQRKERQDEIIKIAGEMRKRVVKYHANEIIAPKYEEMVLRLTK